MVAFSDEAADTLATALMARCETRYQRWKIVLNLDGSSDQANEYRLRRDADHKQLLAQIVTVRSEIKKRGLRERQQVPSGTPARSY